MSGRSRRQDRGFLLQALADATDGFHRTAGEASATESRHPHLHLLVTWSGCTRARSVRPGSGGQVGEGT
ncbi:hypothetical protein [Streptomyces hirsutus]|uniref:hypothetical protein n=1 Tax=Streptomyces hirsutus TaxID=35620 RepID=UPI00146FDFA9|nr:hypothetical protein [Streptomyces hirsutus]